jgi:DNA gyrase subunit B
MQNMLVELAAEDMSVPLKGQDVKGKALVPFLKKLAGYERLLEWFERRRKDPLVLRFLLREGAGKAVLKEKAALKDLLKKMKAELPAITIGDIYEDEEHEGYGVEITRQNYKVVLDGSDKGLLRPEYREIETLYNTIRDLGAPPFTVSTRDGLKEMQSTTELYQYVFEAARKGLSIQRYKGLGEMNPQQLWETTMDPEKRTFLQVSIEDSVQADEIFTILMGDQVEPRKDFIVKHALEAKNIDI